MTQDRSASASTFSTVAPNPADHASLAAERCEARQRMTLARPGRELCAFAGGSDTMLPADQPAAPGLGRSTATRSRTCCAPGAAL